MVDGGCVCGAVRIKTTGEVSARALCFCLDCRKTTGSTFSTNIIVAGDGFSLTKGNPKEFKTTAKSGKTVTSFFCGDCGTTIWRETETYGTNKIIKVGTLDGDALEDAKPLAELFVGNRPSWLPAIAGAQQNEAA
ncbi:putative glutathione-dependent formaldehyde-activating [Diaporthe ampelina]|uniref:Putative glutathione-dependent formaldehyde-activating n=1 Tax=Diaporthe ampelina TaxID=1214573 RepID=A0A0G2FSK6_9PEZI|nr:putative glutathione-dependent formaldehyde-activating [Diaporthe ampelina]